MKYLDPSFNVGGASEAYDEGYERTFGQPDPSAKGKRFVCRTNPETGEAELMEVGADWTDTPRSTGDLGKFEYDNCVSPLDGKTPITSYSKLKRHLKETGMTLSSDYKESWAKARAERDKAYTPGAGYDRASIREAVGRAAYQLERKGRKR